MPPEPLPWDRKDFFKERKHERSSSESLGGGGSARWREAPSQYRWGSTDFRRPTGHGRQGGWHMFSGESCHVSAPSRSNEKILDDQNCRPSGTRNDGKYGRSSRENRGGSFSQRDCKGHSWDVATVPMDGPVRQPASDVNEKWSVDEILTYNSHPHSEFVNNWDQFQIKDMHDKDGGVSALGTSQKFERENSLGSIDWKPIKWTRSGSLSSRGSGFSHSSSSKSMAVDSSETKVEANLRNVTPVQSPSGDAAVFVTSADRVEETSSRKKPRLGWGEGLAKYEKKKVEGPDDSVAKNGIFICGSNTEPVHSHISDIADISPRITVSSDCGSPATPSSVACSSSPGVEDKPFVKAAIVHSINLCGSPCPVPQGNQSEGLAFNLENVGVAPVANLSTSISELLQTDDANSVDPGFVRSTLMNKLLVWKADISKALEVTESEVDLLENELKTLISDSARPCPCPASSSSLPLVCNQKPSEEPCAASNRPASLQVLFSGDMAKEKAPGGLEGELVDKDEDIDSPGSATSKFADPLSLGKLNAPIDTLKHEKCSGNADTNVTGDLAVNCREYAVNKDSAGAISAQHAVGSSITSTFDMDIDAHCDREDTLCNLIVASNKESANRASEVFSKLLPASVCRFDISRIDSSPCLKNNLLVEEKFMMRKRFLRFKERVITLKFRAFQHLWKEDMRLLSVRRCRTKLQKKFEPSLRMVHSGYQKHRASIRSRFSSPAGNLSLVPTTEIINFTSKLLADSHVQMCRSSLKMPALVLDKQEKMILRFISSNGLVEDPSAVEKEKSMINPWTSEEEKVFLDKLAIFGKDFRKISSFLDHKTTADCIEFYYKNHKSEYFQKAKKKPEFAKEGKSFSANTYLVTSGKRWNRETNAASLEMLGAVSAIAANANDGIRNKQICSSRFFFGTSSEYKQPRGEDGLFERSTSLDIFGNERETAAADVLAGICGSISSEAMSSCITSSIDPGEGYQERKCQTVGSSMRRPWTPEVTQKVDDETCSDDSCGEMDPADWTDEEKSIFIQAVSSYGKDFAMISRCVRTRSRDQCKVFFSKARKCLGLDMIHPVSDNDGKPMNDDTNGSGSDTEDACVVENGSAVCSEKLGSKMDENLHLSDLKLSHDEANCDTTMNHPHLDQLVENNSRGLLNHQDTDLNTQDLVSGDHGAEDNADISFGDVSNIKNCVDSESMSLQVHENVVISTAKSGKIESTECVTVEKSVIGQVASDNGTPSVSDAQVEKAVDVGDSEAEKVVHGLQLAGSVLNEEQVENCDVNLSDRSGGNCSMQGTTTVPLSAGNTSLDENDSNSPGFVINLGHENRISMELDLAPNHNVDLLRQDKCVMATNSVLQGPTAVQDEKSLDHDVALRLDFKKTSDKHFQNSERMDDYHQHLSGRSSLSRVDDPSQILRGYPISVSANKGTGEDTSCKKPASLQSISKLDRKFQSERFSPQDFSLQKCNGSKHQDAVAELHIRSQDQLKDHSRPRARSSSDSDRSNHSGNFKLFGQILSNPSAQQKRNSRAQESDDRGSQHVNSSDKSFNRRITGRQSIDGIRTAAMFDRNNYLCLENFPSRSYGFWDGNRIQTGFHSMPDSAILLAKYPAAFGNYSSSSSSRIENQNLNSFGKVNNGSVNGTSVFPTRELSNDQVVADYQVYRSRDPPFSVGMKQRPDIFSEMQRRSEFGPVSSVQQQARGGMVVMGRGGSILLGGGPCNSVSDPVAALKMHYAKAERYSGVAGSITREEESWRGKGDIGR